MERKLEAEKEDGKNSPPLSDETLQLILDNNSRIRTKTACRFCQKKATNAKRAEAADPYEEGSGEGLKTKARATLKSAAGKKKYRSAFQRNFAFIVRQLRRDVTFNQNDLSFTFKDTRMNFFLSCKPRPIRRGQQNPRPAV